MQKALQISNIDRFNCNSISNDMLKTLESLQKFHRITNKNFTLTRTKIFKNKYFRAKRSYCKNLENLNIFLRHQTPHNFL